MSRIVKLTKQLSKDPRLPEELRRAAEILQKPVPGLSVLDTDVGKMGQGGSRVRRRRARPNTNKSAPKNHVPTSSGALNLQRLSSPKPKERTNFRTLSGKITSYAAETIFIGEQKVELSPDTTVVGVIEVGCLVNLKFKDLGEGRALACVIKVESAPPAKESLPTSAPKESEQAAPMQESPEDLSHSHLEAIERHPVIARLMERQPPTDSSALDTSSDQYTERFLEFCRKAAEPEVQLESGELELVLE